MQSLELELERARDLAVADLADAIERIGFECTRCGACCKSEADDPHTATVFPDEVRRLQGTEADPGHREGEGGTPSNGTGTATDGTGTATDGTAADGRDWRDVARPMPYGLSDGPDGPEGETFEWALQTDACGDCVFYEEDETGLGACTVHGDRPLICETYPFSVGLEGTSQPMGDTVDSVDLPGRRSTEGTENADDAMTADDTDDADDTDHTDDVNRGDGSVEAGATVRAHECEGLGRDIDRADAESLAAALKARAVRELEEAIGVRDAYESQPAGPGEVVVHDSEGAKHPDGEPIDRA